MRKNLFKFINQTLMSLEWIRASGSSMLLRSTTGCILKAAGFSGCEWREGGKRLKRYGHDETAEQRNAIACRLA